VGVCDVFLQLEDGVSRDSGDAEDDEGVGRRGVADSCVSISFHGLVVEEWRARANGLYTASFTSLRQSVTSWDCSWSRAGARRTRCLVCPAAAGACWVGPILLPRRRSLILGTRPRLVRVNGQGV